MDSHDNDAAAEAARMARNAAFQKAAFNEPDSDEGLKSNEPHLAAGPKAKQCTSAEVQAGVYAKTGGNASANALTVACATVFTAEDATLSC
jgi:hypothetical protein